MDRGEFRGDPLFECRRSAFAKARAWLRKRRNAGLSLAGHPDIFKRLACAARRKSSQPARPRIVLISESRNPDEETESVDIGSGHRCGDGGSAAGENTRKA
jgi:hypothetical protein